MKTNRMFIALTLFFSTLAFSADEANPFIIGWSCQDTPTCSTEDGNYSNGYALIGGTYYVDGGSPSSCCHIGKNIWNSACKDKENPNGAKVICQK